MEILNCKYDGDEQKDFYDDKRNIIRVTSERGTMWLPLLYTGWAALVFEPENDTVLGMIFDSGNTVYNPKSPVVANGVALIIKNPPHMVGKPLTEHNDEANIPTMLMGGSSSQSDTRHIGGIGDVKIVTTPDMLLLKGPNGNQIAICKDGIVMKGKQISMDFFTNSKAGVLRENPIAAVLPIPVSTILILAGIVIPPYIIDPSPLMNSVKGLADIYRG
jgi:hypothetical protein